MGGGAVPEPATTAGNYHSQPLYSPTVSPFSFNFSTGSPDFIDESKSRTIRYPNQTNFGPVPSEIEVKNAISDLRRAMNGFCATNSEVYEFGEIMGQMRLLDAFNLLQTDPLVQRLVLSISSDNEVWHAILKNDAVQNLQGSVPITAAEEGETGYKSSSNSTSLIVKWIFTVMKLKIMEFMEKLEVLVCKTLYSGSKKARSTSELDDILEEKVRSSLLLSIVILVIVFVTRSIEA
ncbi:hypothetical protein SSX86_012351 [Deinandra increscens subsp. villosa]|uniref:Uncharacterized protein n=1 Tax=Deinandra increscens subsp. villosa TaxID=3103831 RepID=A0AAP0D8K0_9ASTR